MGNQNKLGVISSSKGWQTSSFFDSFYSAHYPWIYHSSLKWIYSPNNTSSDSIWLWSPTLGWFWTKQSVYPYVWIESEGWAYIAKTEDRTWVYSIKSERWNEDSVGFAPSFINGYEFKIDYISGDQEVWTFLQGDNLKIQYSSQSNEIIHGEYTYSKDTDGEGNHGNVNARVRYLGFEIDMEIEFNFISRTTGNITVKGTFQIDGVPQTVYDSGSFSIR